MYSLGSFGVDDGNCDTAKKAERNEALLCVVEPVVLEREGWAFKDARRIQEVEAVSLQIRPAFPFVR